MPRYPTNARQNSQSASRAPVRADSFQGRRRASLDRRDVGRAGNLTQPNLSDPRIRRRLAAEAVTQVAKRVGPRLVPYLNAAMTAYDIWQWLNDARITTSTDVVDRTFAIPANYTAGVVCPMDSNFGERRFAVLSACGATPAQWANPDLPGVTNPSNIGQMVEHRIVTGFDLGPGTEKTWVRSVSVPGQVVDPRFVPAGFPAPGPLTAPRVNPWPSLDPGGEPVEVPGMPVRPSARPVPMPLQRFRPLVVQGQPTRGYRPPWVAPKALPPEPLVMPIPGVGNIHLPGVPPGTEVVLRPGQKPAVRPSQHKNERPPARTKERKFSLSIPSRSVAGVLINAVTETDDFVDDLYRALERKLPIEELDRLINQRRYKGKDGRWYRARIGQRQKWEMVLKYWDIVPIKEAIQNVVIDQVTDRAIAMVGRTNAKAQRNVHDTGFGQGVRNAGAPSHIADHGQLPSAFTWVSPTVRRVVETVLPL